jgi:hypothetical protein
MANEDLAKRLTWWLDNMPASGDALSPGEPAKLSRDIQVARDAIERYDAAILTAIAAMEPFAALTTGWDNSDEPKPGEEAYELQPVDWNWVHDIRSALASLRALAGEK